MIHSIKKLLPEYQLQQQVQPTLDVIKCAAAYIPLRALPQQVYESFKKAGSKL